MYLSTLEWCPALSTGSARIDYAHRELFDLYNRIVSFCTDSFERELFPERIRSFLLYAKWNFEEEERFMRRYEYPNYVEHKQDHERLLQDATDFLESFGSALQPEDGPSIAAYFKHWLTRHTKEKDAELKNYFNSNCSRANQDSHPDCKICGASNINDDNETICANTTDKILESYGMAEKECRSLLEFWLESQENCQQVTMQGDDSVLIEMALAALGRRTPAEAFAAFRHLAPAACEQGHEEQSVSKTQTLVTTALANLIATSESQSVADIHARVDFLESAGVSRTPQHVVAECANSLRQDVNRLCRRLHAARSSPHT